MKNENFCFMKKKQKLCEEGKVHGVKKRAFSLSRRKLYKVHKKILVIYELRLMKGNKKINLPNVLKLQIFGGI
jgi:hypothetical protein